MSAEPESSPQAPIPTPPDGAAAAPGGEGPASAGPSPDLRSVVRKRGKKLNLVDKAGLMTSIEEAIFEAVDLHLPEIDDELRTSVTSSAREGIVRRLKESSRAIRGMRQSDFLRDVMKARAKLLQERKGLLGQLESLKSQMDADRAHFVQEQQNLVRAQQVEGGQQDAALAERIDEIFAGLGDDPVAAQIREQVTSLALMGMHQERQKLLDSKVDEHRSQVEQFERRISKLTQSLESTEGELQRIARMKGIDAGVSSIYRTVQGLGGEDALFAVKRELLSDIFEANLALKEQLAGSQ